MVKPVFDPIKKCNSTNTFLSRDGNLKFVSHGDLLRVAMQRHCAGIQVEPVLQLCRPEKNFWVFKATVFKSSKCRGFVGYGDAHPGNVSPLIFNHAEMRMAETRAVNRALRKAYGIALCSLEELPPGPLAPRRFLSCAGPCSPRHPFRKESIMRIKIQGLNHTRKGFLWSKGCTGPG